MAWASLGKVVDSMNSLLGFFLRPPQPPTSTIIIRLAAGLIFFTQGILKYIDPNMGVIRFTKIGFSHPYFTAHFVGTFENRVWLACFVGFVDTVGRRPPADCYFDRYCHYQDS